MLLWWYPRHVTGELCDCEVGMLGVQVEMECQNLSRERDAISSGA